MVVGDYLATSQWLRNFYNGEAWTKFRLALIAERGPICSRCQRIVTNSIDLIGHHEVELTPENVNDAMISLNPALVSLVCRECHDREHKRFGYENHGRQVFLVYGPPLSGKTTYVQRNKWHQDIVIDLNLLFVGITMLPEYDKPDALLPIVRQVQNQLLDRVKTRFGKWHNAWLVGGYADKHQREQIIADMGAEPIFIEATMEECMARIKRDSRLVFRQSEYEEYVRAWFDRYAP